MIFHHPIYRKLTRHESVSAFIYLTLLSLLFLTTTFAFVDISSRYDALNTSSEALARWEARAQLPSAEPDSVADEQIRGSPFLEGPTKTVASAALLQRLIGAIRGAGGSVSSSEIEPQSLQANDGYVRAYAQFDLEQEALQRLLYEIESGMPFLYVDQLTVHTPATQNEGVRISVLLGVSGYWPSEK